MHLPGLRRGLIQSCAPWLFVALGVAVVSVPSAAQSLDDDDADIVPSGPALIPNAEPGAHKAPVVDDDAAVSWRMPPMPWRAQLGLISSASRSDSGSSSTFFSKNLSASASSYVWQPWFLGLVGNVSATQSDTSGYIPETPGRSYRSGDSFSGGLSAQVLPASRYPAAISLGYGTTSSSGGGATESADYQNLNWHQRYTPIDKKYDTDWNYAWSSFGLDGKRTESNRLDGSLSFGLVSEAPQSLRFTTALSNLKASDGGGGTSAGSLSGQHSIYLEDYVMSISTNASVARDQTRTASQQSAISQSQVGTTMDWIPSDDYPLRIGAGVRYFELGFDNTADSTSSQSGLNTSELNATANYLLNQNWNFFLSSNALVTNFKSGEKTTQGSTYSLRIGGDWRGDGLRRDFDPWTYTLSYGSSLSGGYLGSAGDTTAQSGSVGVWSWNIGNSLTRNYLIDGYRSPISLSLTQSVGAAEDFGSTSSLSSRSLNHAANLRWSPDSDERTNTSIQLGFSDGRSFGESDSFYQSFTSAVDRRWILGSYQSLSGSVSVGINQQGSGGRGDGWKGAGATNVSYGHAQFANVRGLVYSLRYGAVLRPYDVSVNAQKETRWGLEHLLSQSLSWRYGLLSWTLTNDNAKRPYGENWSSLWLTVTRDFGGVL